MLPKDLPTSGNPLGTLSNILDRMRTDEAVALLKAAVRILDTFGEQAESLVWLAVNHGLTLTEAEILVYHITAMRKERTT